MQKLVELDELITIYVTVYSDDDGDGNFCVDEIDINTEEPKENNDARAQVIFKKEFPLSLLLEKKS